MADVYARHDVVLKLSRVEGMFGPPLEGFHRGATCVVTPVTGHDEYVEHGVNGLVVDWDDERGTARALDLLARDDALLHLLRTNALATARVVAVVAPAAQLMALALRRIAARRRPTPTGSARARWPPTRGGPGAERRRAPATTRRLQSRMDRIERAAGARAAAHGAPDGRRVRARRGAMSDQPRTRAPPRAGARCATGAARRSTRTTSRRGPSPSCCASRPRRCARGRAAERARWTSRSSCRSSARAAAGT